MKPDKSLVKQSLSAYTKCPNCQQNVLTSKMFLHEGFCFKNNIVCKYCKKPVLKKNYESHLDTHLKKSQKKNNCPEDGKDKKRQILINQINYNSCLNMNFEKILKPKEVIKINDPIVIATEENQLNTIEEYRDFFFKNTEIARLLNINQANKIIMNIPTNENTKNKIMPVINNNINNRNSTHFSSKTNDLNKISYKYKSYTNLPDNKINDLKKTHNINNISPKDNNKKKYDDKKATETIIYETDNYKINNYIFRPVKSTSNIFDQNNRYKIEKKLEEPLDRKVNYPTKKDETQKKYTESKFYNKTSDKSKGHKTEIVSQKQIGVEKDQPGKNKEKLIKIDINDFNSKINDVNNIRKDSDFLTEECYFPGKNIVYNNVMRSTSSKIKKRKEHFAFSNHKRYLDEKKRNIEKRIHTGIKIKRMVITPGSDNKLMKRNFMKFACK